MTAASLPCRARGFTLVELLVALTVMALMALMSWQGMDAMARAQTGMRERTGSLSGLEAGLAQWTADLDAVMETGQVAGVDFDGRVLRLTRRDPGSSDASLRVVGWARQVATGAPADARYGNGTPVWARWQSAPLRSLGELRDAWAQAQQWGQGFPAAGPGRDVAVIALDQWQLYYFRNNAWSNPQSSATPVQASAPQPPNAAMPAGPVRAAVAPLPDGIRLVLTLPQGEALGGTLTKDWARPTLGGGRS